MQTTPLSPVSACQLWYVDLDQDMNHVVGDTLSQEESERASRFVFERDRRRFRAAHLALRKTLSDLANIPPGALAFEHGAYGKPRLRGAGGFHFNLSHSGGAGLIAWNQRDEVGVDVEQVRASSYNAALADVHFSAAERSQLAHTPPHERDRAFLVGWTRKEACLKAVGIGLGTLDASEVDTGVTEASKRIELSAQGQAIALEVHSFGCGPDLVCAVAKVMPAKARA